LSFEGLTTNAKEIQWELSVTLYLLPIAEWTHGLVLAEMFADGNGHLASVKDFDQAHAGWRSKRDRKYLEDKAV